MAAKKPARKSKARWTKGLRKAKKLEANKPLITSHSIGGGAQG